MRKGAETMGEVRERLREAASLRLPNTVLHFGLTHRCPLCGFLLRGFFDDGLDLPVFRKYDVVGGGRRANAVCPVCRCMDRERLIYLFLKQETDLFQRPQALLHVAPERKLMWKLRRSPALDYVTVDIASVWAMARMDVVRLAFADAAFDVIVCNHVLEHIPDDAKAMAELRRVLKPGGWAVLQVPIARALDRTHEDASITSDEERTQAFGQRDHVRLYGMDFFDRLRASGFSVQVFSWTDHRERYGGAENRFGLNEKEDIFLARKCEPRCADESAQPLMPKLR